MFDSVLVANRGEIACRVLRTVQALGLRGIAVYSEADAGTPHVLLADEAICIGPADVGDSYLSVERVLDAALRTNAGAVHPGYGFLSEIAAFADACAQAGVVFIGPGSAAIRAMGDKASSKQRMRQAGVPCVPGYDGDDPDDEVLIREAKKLGFPLLVKASAGGGGRGMRRVDGPDELAAAIVGARGEAKAAFGNSALLLERLILGARHVEVQVMADQHGTVVSLGERDCSVQRRHQKVIEEAPSPAVDEDLRRRMGDAAERAAAAVDYVGAGTVEFLLAQDGSFFFLEMNTRLQVEHPVTEAITGLDLVALQVAVAMGEPLPASLAEVTLNGHAVEARIYAENPAEGFVPATGLLLAWDAPDGVRVDAGVCSGQVVGSHYDPMLAKVVAWGPDRGTALRRLDRALAKTVTLGLSTNRRFLRRVVRESDFASGHVDTHYLSTHSLESDGPINPENLAIAMFVFLGGNVRPLRVAHPVDQPARVVVNGVDVALRLVSAGLMVDGTAYSVDVQGRGLRRRATVDGRSLPIAVVWDGDDVWVAVGDDELCVQPRRSRVAGAEADLGGVIRAPMAGRVLSVPTEAGAVVEAGAVMVIVEAMKIETSLRAIHAGTVTHIHVETGDVVSAGDVLVEVT